MNLKYLFLLFFVLICNNYLFNQMSFTTISVNLSLTYHSRFHNTFSGKCQYLCKFLFIFISTHIQLEITHSASRNKGFE